MTLTTGMGIAATEKIANDIRPGNRTLPNGQVLSEEAQILLDKSIVAAPLGVPALEEIRIKNFGYRYRWVNRLGQGGSWYMQMKMRGFTLATIDDADPMSVELTTDNGEIRMHDVVLMKIPVEKYQAAIKYNTLRALALQRDKKYLANEKLPSTDPNSDDTAVVHSIADTDRVTANGQYVKTFVPSEEELDSKMGKEKPGRK